MNLTNNQRSNLESPAVQSAIENDLLTFDQGLNLTYIQRFNLKRIFEQEKNPVSMLNQLTQDGVEAIIPSLQTICAFFVRRENVIQKKEIGNLPEALADIVNSTRI